MPTPHYPPAAVRRVPRKLGADIHDARRRRLLSMAVVALIAMMVCVSIVWSSVPR